MRIPTNVTCLHLVSAHELRCSFPLDSVSVKGVVTPNCLEIVFPGVHSDLGGGYAPREQGRGVDPNGEDMLTRIPLLTMYRAARLAGVPLKLELASAVVKPRFKVAPSTITAFNDYLAACTTKTGTLTAIMREQAQYQMQWRLVRRVRSKVPLEATASFSRASTFDQNNVRKSKEVAEQRHWLPPKARVMPPTPYKPLEDGLTVHQRNAAIEYARTGKIPRMITEGREPFDASSKTYYMWAWAGYLRFRKIYSGWDSVLISKNEASASHEAYIS